MGNVTLRRMVTRLSGCTLVGSGFATWIPSLISLFRDDEDASNGGDDTTSIFKSVCFVPVRNDKCSRYVTRPD